jgi:uncharacterized protein
MLLDAQDPHVERIAIGDWRSPPSSILAPRLESTMVVFMIVRCIVPSLAATSLLEASMTSPQYGIADAFVTLPSSPGAARSVDPNLGRWFHRSDAFHRGEALQDMLTGMDEQGVEYAVLHARPPGNFIPRNPYTVGQGVDDESFDASCAALARIMQEYPGRFVGCVPIDPTGVMKAVRQLERAVNEYGIRSCWIMPALIGLPPNHAVYFPVYAKCVELGIPIKINVGVPGPVRFGVVQQPMLLDEVLLAFPELRVIAMHLGHPWHVEVIALLSKHANLYLSTSGWRPRYVPDEIWQFLRTRGRDKILWASDYPLLPFDRTVEDARELALDSDTLRAYLRDNTLRAFGFAEA